MQRFRGPQGASLECSPMKCAFTALCLLAACHSTPPKVVTFGTMREVLREGHSEGRVLLAGIAGPHTIGVGAMENLLGEITILDGRVLIAEAGANACSLREARSGDRAALLVLAEVPAWQESSLPACASYEELEGLIARRLTELGHDLSQPVPVKVHGKATLLGVHVIAGNCPIANPDGPAPWRWSGAAGEVDLVGVFVTGSAGELTHHTHQSHLHAVAGQVSGHLEEIGLSEAVLYLPQDL